MKTITVNGTECFVLPLTYAVEDEIREFCGAYLADIRDQDHVLELVKSAGMTQPGEYAAPWRGDLLVKPVHELDSPPLVIPGDCRWARDLFGGDNARETPPPSMGADSTADGERPGLVGGS